VEEQVLVAPVDYRNLHLYSTAQHSGELYVTLGDRPLGCQEAPADSSQNTLFSQHNKMTHAYLPII